MAAFFDTKIKTFNLANLVNRTLHISSYVEVGGHTELTVAVDVRTGEAFVLNVFENMPEADPERQSR